MPIDITGLFQPSGGAGAFKLTLADDIDVINATDGTGDGTMATTDLLICETNPASTAVKKILISQLPFPTPALSNLASVAINTSLISDTDDTDDLGSAAKEWKDLYIDGIANIDSLIADTADINAGTIDGTTIGASSATTGVFTTCDATTNFTIDGLVLTADTITNDAALTINASGGLVITGNYNLTVGVADADEGILNLLADTDAGGKIIIHVEGDSDTSIVSYDLQCVDDDFLIGSDGDTDMLKFIAETSIQSTVAFDVDAALTATTVDADTDFTVGDTIITNGVVTDSTGLQLAANVSITGTLGCGAITSTALLTVSREDAGTTTILDVATLIRTTSGTAAAGLGGGILFKVEDAGGTAEDAGRIAATLTVATSGVESSALTFQTRVGGGALAEVGRFAPLYSRAISAFASSDGGDKVEVTSTGHPLSDGFDVTIVNSQYAGTYTVEQRAVNTFVIDVNWVDDDTPATWYYAGKPGFFVGGTPASTNFDYRASFELRNEQDNDMYLTMCAGAATDHRAYIGWISRTGDPEVENPLSWLMGRNAVNEFILYDRVQGVHRLYFVGDGTSYIDAADTAPIVFNGVGDPASSTGGVEFWSGTDTAAKVASIDGSGNLAVEGDIGLAADTNLIQLAANALTVNGTITSTGAIQGTALTLTGDTSIISSAHEIDLKMNADTTHYLELSTQTNIPYITLKGGGSSINFACDDATDIYFKLISGTPGQELQLQYEKDTQLGMIRANGAAAVLEVGATVAVNLITTDTGDYIVFNTAANVPQITTVGTCNLAIIPDGGTTAITGALTVSANLTVTGVLDLTGVTGDVSLFDDESIGDTAVGNALIVNRNAATEVDHYIKLYVDSSSIGRVETDGAMRIASGEYVLITAAAGKDIWMNLGDDAGVEFANFRNASSVTHAAISSGGSLFLYEKAAKEEPANVGSAATTLFGQIWVKNDDGNVLMFTDGDGVDYTVDITPV